MAYAKGTSVAPEKSRAEIERILSRYGADAFSYGYEGSRAVVAFRAKGRYVRFMLELPALAEFKRYRRKDQYFDTHRTDAQARRAQEQAIREKWRALVLVVKAKLESVESGIESFDEAFMPHILLPDKTTVAEYLAPQIETAYETGQMPDLLPAARPQLEPGDGPADAEVVE